MSPASNNLQKATEIILAILVLIFPKLWIEFLKIDQLAEQEMMVAWGKALIYPSLILLVLNSFWLHQFRLKVLAGYLLGGGLIMTSLIFWNQVHHGYIEASGFEEDIFRSVYHNFHAPLYFSGHITLVPDGLCGVLIAPSLLLMLAYGLFRKQLHQSYWLWIPGLYLLAALIVFALTDGGVYDRLLANEAHYKSFIDDLGCFENLSDLLAHYVERMHRLGVRGSHYPPGYLSLMMIEQEAIPHLTKIIVIGATLLSFWPMHLLSKLLGLDRETTVLAMILFACSTFMPIWPSFALTPIGIPLGLFGIYFTFRVFGRNRYTDALWLGSIIAIYLYFSFAITLIGVLILAVSVVALIRKDVELIQLAKMGLLAGGVVVIIYCMLYLVSDFNLYDCFVQSFRNNAELMSDGFDNNSRYLIRSTGNLLAFLSGLGIPILVLSAMRFYAVFKSGGEYEKVLTIGIFFTVLTMSFSSLFFLETERIWVIYVPFFCISAAVQLVKYHNKGDYFLVIITLIALMTVSIFEEIYLDHSWGYFEVKPWSKP